MTFSQTPADDQQQNQPAVGQEQDWKAHPSWDGVLEMFPEGAQRDALIAQIRTSDTNSQKAIEQARANQTPDEWQQLIRTAQEAGVDPNELVESYNQVDTMREQIAADPDAWLSSMQTEIEQAVERGDITRREGNRLKKDATQQAADAGTVDLEDPALAEVRQELDEQKRWRQQQEQVQRQQEEADRQAQVDADIQQRTQTFMSTFEGTFNNDPVLKDVEPETRFIVANHALNLMAANESMTEKQATDAAIGQFQERFGLPKAQAQQPVPIGGGTNGSMQQPATAGRGVLGGVDKAREQAMLEALKQQQGAGIS